MGMFTKLFRILANDPRPVDSPPKSPGEKFHDTLRNGAQGPIMIVVPAGSFTMGDTDGSGNSSERPAHLVHLRRPFAIGIYPVTFDEYDAFTAATGRDPIEDYFQHGRGRIPVNNTDWEQAIEYTQWLSAETGKPYRLPTEAEWEYAARAGTQTAFWWGDDARPDLATCRFAGSAHPSGPTPVGSHEPNPFGLYDMVGNVWEWCRDWYHRDYGGAMSDGFSREHLDPMQARNRVIRGGAWNEESHRARCAYRNGSYFRSTVPSATYGFRLVRDLYR